MSVESDLTQVT